MWVLVKESVWAWIDDYAASLGAAIAFYTIFSLAPILIIVIFVAGLVFGEETARIELMSQISEFVGQDAAAAVEGVLEEASRPGSGILAMAFSIVVLVVGATTVFTELRSALNRIWQVPDPPEGGIWAMLWSRAIAFVLVLAVAALLLGLVAVSAVLSALGDVWSAYIGGWDIALRLLDLLVSFAILTTLFALIYQYVPRADIAWSDVWLGAGVTAVLFILGRYLIGLYLGTVGVGSGFGAAGSLVVLLMWVYYSAQIFLLGAEFTWVYAHRHGSRAAASPPDKDGRRPEHRPPLAGGMKLVGVVAAIGFVIGMITRR
ncbi:MAG TPA: YihY/virulence factor BrkB family protein [Aestuariivirgaceae bacterium]|nr:YihY/virulence factor BrkB family protein [Aestuariivirgaceae bacterium]